MQPIPAAEQAVRTDDIATIFDFHRAGEFNAARRRCQRALRHGSSDARLSYLMACLEIHADNPGGASQWFVDAIATEAALVRHSNPTAADIPPAFAETLACDPRPELVCHKLGLVACARGKMLAACLALKAWLTHAPGDVTALLRLGDVAGQLEDHALAKTCLEKALRLDPDHAAIALKLGNARSRRGELHGALDAYQRAALLEPDNPQAHFFLGSTLHGLKDFAGAEAALPQAASRSPETNPAPIC